MNDRIAEFLATVYSPANLDSAPEKLRQAVELLREIESNEALLLEEVSDAKT